MKQKDEIFLLPLVVFTLSLKSVTLRSLGQRSRLSSWRSSQNMTKGSPSTTAWSPQSGQLYGSGFMLKQWGMHHSLLSVEWLRHMITGLHGDIRRLRTPRIVMKKFPHYRNKDSIKTLKRTQNINLLTFSLYLLLRLSICLSFKLSLNFFLGSVTFHLVLLVEVVWLKKILCFVHCKFMY